MDFFLSGVGLWIVIGSVLLLLILGLRKKSWQAIILSGAVLLLPTLSLAVGASDWWHRLPIILPLAIFVLAYFMKKRTERII
ncbi:hypothetical protein BTO28_12125 [Domibacillus epiphyticus]|uniref:Uncharacterized protein n=1 Tax=Domibacillus epiphyticus TaxID=1714355 RepID=A0A1V2A629_9BACI|nr:hypothetical protein BTO28_12125 [Domibacillus epiphyticus]